MVGWRVGPARGPLGLAAPDGWRDDARVAVERPAVLGRRGLLVGACGGSCSDRERSKGADRGPR
jgi:hypothetical protein